MWHEAILNQIAWVHSFHLDVADDASATPAPHRTQSQEVSGVPWGTGYFEECLVKGRCCTLRPTPVTKRNGTLPPAKIMRRFSQLTHGSLVPCVVQLCPSPHCTQSQVSGVPWGAGYFEECLAKVRC